MSWRTAQQAVIEQASDLSKSMFLVCAQIHHRSSRLELSFLVWELARKGADVSYRIFEKDLEVLGEYIGWREYRAWHGRSGKWVANIT